MTSNEINSLLSSLPSELCFNDLRDAGRRHKRAEKTDPKNLHCVASKSAEKRPMGCKTLALSAEDWTEPLDKKALKTNIYNALRATDVSLGVDSTGLTRNPSNMWLTKPHILCQRMELLLLAFWSSCAKLFFLAAR